MQKFKRILLKVSGEGLAAQNDSILNAPKLAEVATDIKALLQLGMEIAIVVGGGNVCRGAKNSYQGFSRVTLDNIGMLSTVINGLAVADVLQQHNVPCVVVSAVEISKFTEFYNVAKTSDLLEQKKVVILVGGIANPYFSTDIAAVIKAAELNCGAVFKATQVNGIYDKDPLIHQDAVKIDRITYDEVIHKQLTVMDLQSIIIAKSINMPIYIYNMHNNSMNNLINGNLDYSVIS